MCCLHLQIAFAKEHSGPIENSITWSNGTHLNLNISQTVCLAVNILHVPKPNQAHVHAGSEVYVGKTGQTLRDSFTSFTSKTHKMNLIDMQNGLERMKLTF